MYVQSDLSCQIIVVEKKVASKVLWSIEVYSNI